MWNLLCANLLLLPVYFFCHCLCNFYNSYLVFYHSSGNNFQCDLISITSSDTWGKLNYFPLMDLFQFCIELHEMCQAFTFCVTSCVVISVVFVMCTNIEEHVAGSNSKNLWFAYGCINVINFICDSIFIGNDSFILF